MNSLEILKNIRRKLQGTAEEHDLLRHLIHSETEAWKRAADGVAEQFAEREAAVAQREKTAERFDDAIRVDAALYWWQSDPDDYSWLRFARTRFSNSFLSRSNLRIRASSRFPFSASPSKKSVAIWFCERSSVPSTSALFTATARSLRFVSSWLVA